MKKRRRLRSWLAPYFERFIALRRAGLANYVSQERMLLAFDRFLAKKVAKSPLRRETLLAYLQSIQPLFQRSQDNIITVVWQALAYAIRHGAAVDPLPPRPRVAARWLRLRRPHILSAEDIQAVLKAARGLPPAGHLRAATSATIVGLLYSTGMRIGEALALNVGDIDLRDRLLTVRRGKFGKARILPLRPSTVAALECYLRHPKRPIGIAATDPIFVSLRRRRLSHSAAMDNYSAAFRVAGIVATHSPRLHDIRHTFAVRRVAEWYAEGRDVNALLPALSTYLGHVSVENTRAYLRENGLLLEQASARFEANTTSLDQGSP